MSFITMKSSDLLEKASIRLEIIRKKREELFKEVVEKNRRNSIFLRRLLIVPLLLEKIGMLKPVTFESASKDLPLSSVISYTMPYSKSEEVLNDLVSLCKESETVNVSSDDLYYLNNVLVTEVPSDCFYAEKKSD